jgi:hypothetical protein
MYLQTVDPITPADEDPLARLDDELWALCLRCGQWYNVDGPHWSIEFVPLGDDAISERCDGHDLRALAEGVKK